MDSGFVAVVTRLASVLPIYRKNRNSTPLVDQRRCTHRAKVHRLQVQNKKLHLLYSIYKR
nr:MAG TPA: hypothetical protein [Caudoviricetes sp.]